MLESGNEADRIFFLFFTQNIFIKGSCFSRYHPFSDSSFLFAEKTHPLELANKTTMRLTSRVITLLSLALCAFAAVAPQVSDSGKQKYEAKFNKGAKGSIKFNSDSKGEVKVQAKLQKLPKEGGPFLYYIHEKPVPSDGDCAAIMGNFNPYMGSQNATLNATEAAGVEVGDLSGKHGNITKKSFKTSYVDPYLSLNETDPAFIGNRSIAIQYANGTRFACANITHN